MIYLVKYKSVTKVYFHYFILDEPPWMERSGPGNALLYMEYMTVSKP